MEGCLENWLYQNSAVLIAALIGVFGALAGVITTAVIENKRRRKELVDKAKPIIINCPINAIKDRVHVPRYAFLNSDDKGVDSFYGFYKNTDNGIVFLDSIETETKKYLPQRNSAVDKNSTFIIELSIVEGETLKKCRIHCHDIFGNKYYYDAEYVYDHGIKHLLIGNLQSAKK